MYKVFKLTDAKWRGIGNISGSGLGIREEYALRNTVEKFNLAPAAEPEPLGCRCGEVLKGQCIPSECPLFQKICTSQNPVGPCMVSAEGACNAYFRYEVFSNE